MMKRILRLIVLGAILSLASCTGEKTPVYLDDSKSIEERVEDALQRMTFDEKIAIIHAQSKFSSPGVPRLGIPEVWCSDGPHGIRMELLWDAWRAADWTNDYCTAFPALTCLAASWDREMSAIYGKALGEEARYRNKNVLLGPGLNIYRTPLNGRNFEYLGEDPYLAGKMSVPYIQEVQKVGVAACVKHYALNNQEYRRNDVDVKLSDRALYEIYLPAFKEAVQVGKAWSIMGSYNLYDGQHCCHNKRLLVDILRGEWGFDGAVVSDWGGVHSTEEALNNGLDLEYGTWTNGLTLSEMGLDAYDAYHMAVPLKNYIASGKGDAKLVDEKARNVLRLIFRTTMNRNRPYGSFATDEHAAVSRRIAENGIVLLKNENRVLPIKPESVNNILVVGENADYMMTVGGGSSELKVKKEVSPIEGLRALYGEEKIAYMKGYTQNEDEKLESIEALKCAAAEADAVIFVGGLNKKHFQDCESRDRKEFGLPYGQDAVIEALCEANPRTAVVIISGNAVATPWLDKAPAIVEGWYLGSEAGNALARVLSGEVNPSGKLPFTYYTKLEDCGAHNFGDICYPGLLVNGEYPHFKRLKTDTVRRINLEYKEDIFVGYRWVEKYNIKPAFAFGHGLSYTTFEYTPVSLSRSSMKEGGKIVASLRVKNTGDVAGSEVVQLYIGDDESSVVRPVKELKGFEKVHLEVGESAKVKFEISADDLKFFDEAKHDWVAEKGTFTVYIGASSADIRSTAKFELR
ncbi:MAG: glycoside hydrolase family 3 C-terminal domain-containing protein [Alistipes sp.]|nr:glycoside hydrolase family 3 C-terminal domain-containing protein [Alistipes sp.]